LLGGGPLEAETESAIQRDLGGGRALEPDQRASAERSLGADFSGVRIHADANSDRLNRSLSARAFTVGSDIFFSRGAFSPNSGGGKELLTHELAHVVQQGQGARDQRGGSQGNKVQTKLQVGPAHDRYEHEADHAARKAAQAGPAPAPGPARRALQRGPAVQRALVVGSVPVSQSDLTETTLKVGDREITFEESEEGAKAQKANRIIKGFLKIEAVVEFDSVEDLDLYLKDPITNKSKMKLRPPEEVQETIEPPTEKKKKGTWWKWALGVLGMIPGIGGAMLGAKMGYQKAKGGWKGVLAGMGGAIVGAVVHAVAAAIAPVAGAMMGAIGGARAGYNKVARGRGALGVLGGLFAGLGGGIAGALGGAFLGLGSTTVGAGPQAVDPAMVDEAFGTTETTERMKAKKVNMQGLKAGDIVLVHGGEDMGTGFIKFGQSLHQLWSGQSRRASTGFRHAGVYVGMGTYAHVGGGGASIDNLPAGVLVYRSNSAGLAKQASSIATDWARYRGEIQYASAKAAGSMLNSSDYSSTRAAVLASYAKAGITPGDMFCSEFAISVYQAAALMPAFKDIDKESTGKLTEVGDNKKGVKKWAKENKSKFKTPSNMLKLDPRTTSPQRLAAELARLSEGEDPQWQFVGQFE
jgi:hypothetical protein